MEEEQCPCAVHIVVGSTETLNLTVRIVTRWIFEQGEEIT